MSPEQEAADLIRTLESLVDELRAVENGKNYTPAQARERLDGIRMALGAEGVEG